MFKLKNYGFTIVELLIVIVVIGVLATISIVSYNGIREEAIIVGCKSDMSSAKKKIEMYKIEKGDLPRSLTKAGAEESDVCDLSYYFIGNIEGYSSDLEAEYLIYGEKDSVKLIATDTSIPQEMEAVESSGGDITTDNRGYKVHIFKDDAEFKITSSDPVVVELLVVAGGGGGGTSQAGKGGGGGGGAGGLIYYDNYLVPAGIEIGVEVGLGGGPGVPQPNPGDNGMNSKFGSLEAIGGGGGGGQGLDGLDGGSGGGAGANRKGGMNVSGQGSKGGNKDSVPYYGGAGGGGFSSPGSQYTTSHVGGLGGNGKILKISGESVEYSKGGRGGGSNHLATEPTPNTGGGGDGAYSSRPATAGADGVVIIRYKN